ncbi:MAG: aminoacyl--tRNA ligase-related protein, partial [Chloracidobacterium sp.]
MLGLDVIRQNFELVCQSLVNRRADLTLDAFRELDVSRRRLIGEVEQHKATLNRISPQIGALLKAGQQTEAEAKRAEMRELKSSIEMLEAELESVEHRLQEIVRIIPNPPHASVPIGDESANQEISRWGEPRQFDFPPKDHVELGTALGILDLERAAKISGARFAVLKGVGARLERALISFMLDLHLDEHGYTEVLPPFLVNGDALFGTGQLPKFEADLFKLTDERGLYLIPTAEVPVTNLHRGEVLDSAQLPLRYVAYTPCFRSEAGS